MKQKIGLLTLLLTSTLLSAISISTLEDLQKIGVDAAFPLDGEYLLAEDIDASSTADMNDGKGFTPIGIGWGNGFTGSFDGDGHAITGLTIVSEEIDGEFIGLFGTLDEGSTVKNLQVLDASVRGKARVGIIAGRSKGTVENCIVSGYVSSIEGNVGGIVGTNGRWDTGGALGSVKKCIAYVEVTTSGYHAGGIAGWTYMGSIEECAVFGTVHAQRNAGGIGGNGGEGFQIIRSFSMAEVSADSVVGGITAESYSQNTPGLIEDCWAAGRLIGAKKGGILYNGNTGVTNSYWDREKSDVSTSAVVSAQYGVSTEAMLKQATFGNWDFETVWSNVEGKSFPSLQWMNFPTATVTYEAEDNGSLEGELTQTSDPLTVLSPVTAKASAGYSFIRWSDTVRTATRRDIGFVSDTTLCAHFAEPVAITSLTDLESIGITAEFPLDYHYYLTGDIDGGNALFSPIGGTKPFFGSLDGKGFSISNLTIIGAEERTGLFYTIAPIAKVHGIILDSITVEGAGSTAVLAGRNNGTVNEVFLSNSSIVSSKNIVGSLVGVNSGTIYDCRVSGVTVATDSVVAGGFVGYNLEGEISRSSSDAVVSSYMHAGGFVGYVNKGSISECASSGEVSVLDWAAGGFAGFSLYPSIMNCYSTATVTGLSDTTSDVAGLIGRINSGGVVQNCYAAAPISGGADSTKGGLYGRIAGSTYSVSSYWDKELSTVTTSSMGEGFETAKMKQQSTYLDWDFTSIWTVGSEGYPVLQWQLEDPQVMISDSKVAMIHNKGSIKMSLAGINVTLPQGVKRSKLQLFQPNGRKVYEFTITGNGTVPMPPVSRGFYIAKLNSPKSALTTRLLFQ
jgi:hypothetical protein